MMKTFLTHLFDRVGWAALVALAGMGGSPLRAGTQLTLGTAASAPGFSALLPISLATDTNVAGLQFDLAFNPEHLLTCDVSAGSALAGQVLNTRLISPGLQRVLIYCPTNLWLTNGTLAACQFTIADGAPLGVETISFSNLVVAAPGTHLWDPVDATDGTLAIFGGALLHGVQNLSWLLGAEPTASKVTITAVGMDTNYVIYSGLIAGAKPAWSTAAAANGSYQIKAIFQGASGQTTREYTRQTAVNNAVAWHAGILATNQVWSNTTVHVVESTLLITSNATVTIEPGTVIKFAHGASIIIDSNSGLYALGRSGSNIVFTSLADDSVGGDVNLDGSNSLPAPGDWLGVVARANSQLNLNEFTQLRYLIALHKGTLSADEIWDGTQLHRVTDDVTVNPNATLTIKPGAVIKFDLGKKLTVSAQATILAQGSVAQPIVFTSIRDDSAGGDSNLDGDKTVPAAGDWGWIFLNGGVGIFSNCLLTYGGGPAEGGWGPPGDPLLAKGMIKTTGNGASLVVSNCTFVESFYDGILAWGGEATIVNSVLAGIDRAVSAHPNSSVHVLNCSLYNNRLGLLVHGGTLFAENTIVANSIESGIQYDFGRLAQVRYCDVWAPANSTSINYRNTGDQTAQNGNISADPRFKGPERLNFRLNYGSPAIDAADGIRAPATDMMGAPRFTYPHSSQAGTPSANGAFPDLGAFEFADAAPSGIDLIVTEVKGPSAALAGDLMHLEWVVANKGNGLAEGPWHDAIYLLDAASTNRLLVGEILVAQGVSLGPEQTYTASADVRVPGGVVQSYRWQVEANSRGEVFEGQNRGNNQGSSVATVTLDLPALQVNGPALNSRFEASNQPQWFKLIPAGNQDVQVSLTLSASQGVTELYIGKGYLPSPQTYDFRQREWNSANVTTLVADATTNIYYITAYPRALPANSISFAIRAAMVDFVVQKANPPMIGNGGLVTLEILGANLRPGTGFSLQATNGQRWTAQNASYIDSGRAYATFLLTNFPPGYASVVADQTNALVIASNLVQVVAGGSGNFYASIAGPSVVRLGRSATWYVTYGNNGLIDVPLPFLRISMPGAQEIKLFTSTLNWADQFVLLALNDRTLLPTLGPGQEVTVAVAAKPGPNPLASIEVETMTGQLATQDATLFNWQDLPVPAGADPAVFSALLDDLNNRLGRTLGEYYALLMRDLAEVASANLTHKFVANINGQWLFGPETLGAPVFIPPPSVDVSVPPVSLMGRSSTLQDGGSNKHKDGVRRTKFVVIVDADYNVRGANNLVAQRKTVQDLKQFLFQDLRVPAGQYTFLYDSIESSTDTLTPKNVLDTIRQAGVDGDDNLVIIYSGHGGITADGKGRMALNGGDITPEAIQGAIDQAGAGTTYFINDSCYSASVTSHIRPTNSLFVGLSATTANKRSYMDENAGAAFIATLKNNMRNCNNLHDAFFKASDAIERWSGGNESPDIQNPGAVNLNEKPWNDPTGFSQKVSKKLKGAAFAKAKSASISVVGSIDPNDKLGPGGAGAANFIGISQVLPYTINFENKSTAQAPAQEVMIVDQLDANLDWSTFELVAIGFNDVKITAPQKLQRFGTTVQVGSDPNPVVVQVSLDLASGQATWQMQSVDPVTGDLPEDPFAGFLPPNDASHRGEGYVSFRIQAKTNLTTGALLRNQATIYFDPAYGLNQPINTPWVMNTIDAVPPSSSVEPLPAQSATQFVVRWNGADDAAGSGLATYDLYVSKNLGPFTPWLTSQAATQAIFEGEKGALYQFYSLARDFAGNLEAAPLLPDAWTQVVSSPPLLKAKVQGNSLVLTVEDLIPGQHYAIDRSASLDAGDWTVLQEFDAVANTFLQTIILPAESKMSFFRVRISSATP